MDRFCIISVGWHWGHSAWYNGNDDESRKRCAGYLRKIVESPRPSLSIAL